MDDLISRKWLIEVVEEGWIKFDSEKDYNKYIHLVRDTAPSAEPERKKGKWKRRIVDSGYNADWICSECGHRVKTDFVNYNFCPNCGSYNGGDSDD